MSAMIDLDRYIQEHEVTLDTINQSKLRRNPIAYQHNKLNSSILSNNSGYFRNNDQHERNITSVENDLLQFINHLKQMQKFRIHQLQQVNALFNYNMDLEDLSNTDLVTEEESQQIDENAEFEAFLLGTESKEEESHEGNMIHTSVEHNTSSNTAVDIKTNDDTKLSVEVEDDLCFTEEDTIISLRRNRLDRSARLHAVSHALRALHSTALTSSTTHTHPAIEEHTIITRTQGNSNITKAEQERDSCVGTEQEASPRARVLQLAQQAIALSPRPSLQPTATESTFSSPVASYKTAAQSRAYPKEFLASLEDDDVPPPPPPPPSSSLYSTDGVAASCETAPLVGTISLQALAEDDLYLSRTSSAVKTLATERCTHSDSATSNIHSHQRRAIHDRGDGTIVEDGRDQCGASLTVNVASPLHHTAAQYSPTPTQTMKHKPYLINNARRHSLHCDTNRNISSSNSNTSSGNPYKSRTSRVRTPPKHPDLSISSIALHSEDGRSRSNSSSSCSSSGASDREDSNIVGIGFGHRYGNSQKTHNTSVRGGNKPREVQWEEWNKETNSADEDECADVDSVYSHKYRVSDETGTGGQNRLVVGKETSRVNSSRGSSSNSNSAHLFELVDALESPVSKPRQHGKHRETGTTQYPQQQPHQVPLKSSASDRAVTAASHINSCDQHPVCTSQKDDTSNMDLYHNDVNYPDTTTSSEAFHSPERSIAIAKSEESSYTSPVPTTPTFSPLFS